MVNAAPEPSEPKKRGKKPTPKDHVKVYKTAVFKLHNPSRHKCAMLKDSLRRAHPNSEIDVDRIVHASLHTPARKRDRFREMNTGSLCIGAETIAVAQRRRLVVAAEGGKSIGGGAGDVLRPATIFPEIFFVAGEGSFANGEFFSRAPGGHKKARKIAAHAICVRMLGAKRLFADC